MQLDFQVPAIEVLLSRTKEEFKKITTTPKTLEEVYDKFEQHNDVVAEQARFVDDSFAFISNLELSPALKLATGLLISFSKTKDKQDLQKAIAAINAELGE